MGVRSRWEYEIGICSLRVPARLPPAILATTRNVAIWSILDHWDNQTNFRSVSRCSLDSQRRAVNYRPIPCDVNPGPIHSSLSSNSPRRPSTIHGTTDDVYIFHLLFFTMRGKNCCKRATQVRNETSAICFQRERHLKYWNISEWDTYGDLKCSRVRRHRLSATR